MTISRQNCLTQGVDHGGLGFSKLPQFASGDSHSSGAECWLNYDAEAGALCVNFKKPSIAADSEMTDEDVIVRYEGGEVIGFSVLHASQR